MGIACEPIRNAELLFVPLPAESESLEMGPRNYLNKASK